MCNMKNKIILIIILSLTLISCGNNRFKDRETTQIFTFGFYPKKNECDKLDLTIHSASYKNGVYPTRTCMQYKDYLCRINKVCNGGKKCEQEAAQYWLKGWKDKNGKWLDSITTTKNYCEAQKKNCDSAKKGDHTCKKIKNN